MYRSFKDEALAQTFTEDGCVLLPLLDNEDINELMAFYGSLDNTYKTGFGFHVSIDDQSPEFIERIHKKVIEVCFPRLEKHLADLQAFSGRFLVKEPNRYGIVTPHQDWSFVDESKSCSAIVWVALVDVDIQNGALGVLKGSQKLHTGYRATPLPLFKAPYAEYVNDLFAYLELIPMRAGEAVIMDNRLIHGSPPNTAKHDRIVAGFEVATKGTPLIHYYLSKRTGQYRILKYDIDKSFFYHYSNAKLKELHETGGEITGFPNSEVLEYRVEPWSRDQFHAFIHELGDPQENPILKGLFDYSFGHTEQVPDLGFKKSLKPGRKSLLEVIKSWV